MREIKFRAWDEEAQKMSYSTIEHFDDMLGFRFEHFETDEPIFMQYTGLKDKNGREIYEGDIVKWTRISYTDCSRKEVGETAEFIGEIKWCDTIWGIYLSNGVGHLLMPYYLETDEFEVIGNIYENPELLSDQKIR